MMNSLIVIRQPMESGMSELIGALVGILVAVVMIPVVILIVLFALAAAGISIAVGLAFGLLGIVLHLFFALAPFILVGLIVYWLLRPSAQNAKA